ncbi:flagellar hook-basal body complex protein FliE [Kerstersia gyiorum]|uniref:flagellar hook-basal body complex protein FliE n=1 Tax=Kerstersia gyiorum TaxID=206506 RepID=UPI003B42DCBB
MAMVQMSGIEQLLSSMRELARAAGAAPAAEMRASGAARESGFAQELQRSLARVSSMQESANQQAQAYEAGQPGIALNDVMLDMQKAGIAFQMTVQVRNRFVAAYQEISSMPV